MGINIIEKNNGDEIIAYKTPDFMDKSGEDVGNKEDDFLFLKVIGSGSFSQVFKVKSRKNYQIYAMKKVKLENNEHINYLENEEKLLPKLNHLNIIKCYKVFRDQNNKYLYFIMELMNNGDLESFKKAFMNLKRNPPEKILWKIFYDCLKGLTYVHGEEIIHRDIKPKNLFFDENMKVKIGDFNISMASSEGAAKKFSGSNDANVYTAMMDYTPAGTEEYLAPEVARYDCSEKNDVYSLGVTFFELCYFEIPGEWGVDKEDYFEKNIYSKELNDLLRKMLKYEPEDRISSFDAKALAKKYYIQKYVKNTSVESVLRCLYNFPNLNQYFRDLQENSLTEGKDAQKCIYYLFKYFGENNKDKIDDNLYELRKVVEKTGLQIRKKNIEIDPGILIFYLLSRLNSELNEIHGQVKMTTAEYIKSGRKYRIESGQEENFFKERLRIYNKRILSIISRNFCNYIKTDIKCSKCNEIGHYFSQAFFIPFNVEIFAKKMENANLHIKNGFDCLNKDSIKVNPKKGIICKKCNDAKELIESKKFYHTAKNLIIILDRGKEDIIDTYVDFDENFNLNKNDVERYTDINYKLIGIIEKLNDNRYISFSQKNNLWISSDGVEKSFDEVKKYGKVMGLFYYSENDNLILQSQQSQLNENINQQQQGIQNNENDFRISKSNSEHIKTQIVMNSFNNNTNLNNNISYPNNNMINSNNNTNFPNTQNKNFNI